mmetsp:Transcript_52145/g.113007  ORF Transcript_52145/g.113007 Transcript_52145/m.113007 type:complete len:268 (-) Transcript_52145:349-1152(-)
MRDHCKWSIRRHRAKREGRPDSEETPQSNLQRPTPRPTSAPVEAGGVAATRMRPAQLTWMHPKIYFTTKLLQPSKYVCRDGAVDPGGAGNSCYEVPSARLVRHGRQHPKWVSHIDRTPPVVRPGSRSRCRGFLGPRLGGRRGCRVFAEWALRHEEGLTLLTNVHAAGLSLVLLLLCVRGEQEGRTGPVVSLKLRLPDRGYDRRHAPRRRGRPAVEEHRKGWLWRARGQGSQLVGQDIGKDLGVLRCPGKLGADDFPGGRHVGDEPEG